MDVVVALPLRQFVRSHQSIKASLTDFDKEFWSVGGEVPGQVVIAGGALFMAVVFIEAQLRVRACRAVMTCMILTVVMATTANAWL